MQGVLAIHVDDMFATGSEMFEADVLAKLKQIFPFKHWKENGGEFLGRMIERKEDGEIVIHLREYAEKLKVVEISRERRRQKDSPINGKEKSQLRGIAGALNWLTTASRQARSGSVHGFHTTEDSECGGRRFG